MNLEAVLNIFSAAIFPSKTLWKGEVLIAGDSNVHRINGFQKSIHDMSLNCLPISGARFTNDRKSFREQLVMCLQKGSYKRLYLVLGSNDVLRKVHVFYRNVTEVLDLVHETSPSTQIVLCEILPRGPNQRRRLPANQLSAMKTWICEANNTLLDVSTYLPYVRFLGFSNFLVSKHLVSDGLHLNVEGAGHCYSLIANDCSMTPRPERIQTDFVESDWPTLGDVQTGVRIETDCPLYSDVARIECSPVLAAVTPVMKMRTPKKKRVVCIRNKNWWKRCNAQKTFEQRRKRWHKKRFARKINVTRRQCPQENVMIDITSDIAVQIPAHKIAGFSLVGRDKVSDKNTDTNTATMDRSRCKVFAEKRQRRMQWFSCPECRVHCSHEDHLLDHIIRRHTKIVRIKDSIPNTKMVAATIEAVSDDCPENTTDLVQTSDVKVDVSRCIDVEDHTRTSFKLSPSCEGLYDIFPQSQWQNLFQLVMLGHLCGGDGLHFVMMRLLIENEVNTSRLRLLLSNDVEQNPGPVYKCGWSKCEQSVDTPGKITMHAIEHVHKERQCQWEGCNNTTITEFDDLWPHVLEHVYNNKEYTPTLEEWYKFLPGGVYKEDKISLRKFPLHLRSKLQLLLFDEDFPLPSRRYTAVNHRAYINKLSIDNPPLFKQMISEFIRKRQTLGEDWSTLTEMKTEAFTSTASDTIVQRQTNSNTQNGTTPGLVETQHKRKWSQVETFPDHKSAWSIILLKNLSACDYTIKLQHLIIQTMVEKSIVTASNQRFFKLEQEAARLASLNQCTNGTFVCTIFKCFFDEKEILYVRYVESGVYNGLMLQKFVEVLKSRYSVSDESIFLHNALTMEDIDNMKTENDEIQLNRNRPDKSFKHSIKKVIPQAICNLKEFGECPEIKLDSFVIHALPFKSKVTVDTPEQIYLEVENPPISCLKTFLIQFRLNKIEQPVSSSKDILTEFTSVPNSLMQQSVILNCLSGDIKRKPYLFSSAARFQSNFFNNRSNATSLRNQTLQLYLQNRTQELISFFENYFPELNIANDQNVISHSDNLTHSKRLKRSVSKVVKRLVVTKNDVEKQLQSAESVSVQENPVNIYESYCLSLLEHGTLKIQYYDESTLVCLMNDYDETDGSFRNNDFVYTVKHKQEIGDYIYCSCKIYSTLINVKNYTGTSVNEGLQVLDHSDYEHFVTCIHCMFLKERVLPEIEPCTLNQTQSRLNIFIQKALNDKGKAVIELSRNKDTRKYSIITEDEDRPAFVHLSFNKCQGNYVVSCNNGKCLSVRGHKRSVSTLASSVLCKHLSIFREHNEYWQEFVECPKPDDTSETNTNEDSANLGSGTDNEINFDETSGLWSFKCKSTHSPNNIESPIYKSSVIKRDSWNDHTMERLLDGCLKGPVLVSDIPDSNCDCGSGWLRKTDEENYCDEGLTRHEKSRLLTIYTSIAPVKCEVHTRLCNNPVSPCKILWDEGQRDSIHVLSRDTAAGDEIGWEFVSMVMKSGCTFSAYCQLKTDLYQARDSRATFMDSTVFIYWWFSWAANMKIDFRKPCDACGFEPKRLCCDGTRVGVGFRHATFEEINKTDPNIPVELTLHRRMDRCFLKNMNGIDKQQMIKNRETLNYLARKEIGDITDKELIDDNELGHRINSVKVVLPEEVLPSFERFFVMAPSEKLSYAHVLKMISSTASMTSLLPPSYCTRLQQLVNNPNADGAHFNTIVHEMRSYAPELRDLIIESMLCNNEIFANDIRLFIQYLINESLDMQSNESEIAVPQPGTYNPAKFGRAYYFNESGLKLRNVRKFTIDEDKNVKRNVDHDDNALDFERCQKLFSKVQNSAHGTSNLFLWFCADHGHCYGFHMTGAEGRKDPSASLYSHLEKPPQDVFYDFACNLQEYCLNRESGFYKDVRFFHDIFHSYAHKCSCSFKSTRLQGFESVNSEICEQFNSFLQCIKRSARQMSQTHFCFYLQFFLHEWNEKKRITSQKKLRIALAGMIRP